MASHYGVHIIDDAHKNAMNVVYALWKGEDPTQSENFSQPVNASGLQSDAVTYWLGGRQYSDADLAIIQAMVTNIPTAIWPVQGVSGPVTLLQATAAATALVVNVTTQDTYTTAQAQTTLAAVLTALGMKRVVFA